MKNKTVSVIYMIFSFISALYFTALQIASPSVISFSYVWLILAAIFLAGAVSVKKRQSAQKYIFLENMRTSPQKQLHVLRRTLIACFAAAAVISLVNLCFICMPSESGGTAETKYIIVLGGGIRRDGTLTDVPKKRIEKAAAWMKNHPDAKAIVTGGQGRFAPCAEAPVLAAEMEKNGIPSERIIQEDKAKDTIQNFEYSAKLIAADENSSLHTVTVQDVLSQPVTVVTSRFHLRRAERLASRIGFKTVYGLGTKTAPLFAVNDYCREICAYIKLNLRILLTGKPARMKQPDPMNQIVRTQQADSVPDARPLNP